MNLSYAILCGGVALLLFVSATFAQQAGDQVIDGIGETALIARYPLDGTATDRSRNGWTAQLAADSGSFVDAAPFGRVLTLTGRADGGLRLPRRMFDTVESVTLNAWIRLRTDAADQALFDFATKEGRRMSLVLTGEKGFRIAWISSDQTTVTSSIGPSLVANEWVHIALVLDASEHKVFTYLDGERVGEEAVPDGGAVTLFDPDRADSADMRIGPSLDGFLRDLRLYSVPLKDEQIATIYRNALPTTQTSTSASTQPESAAGEMLVDFGGRALVGVADIEIRTPVGHLPKLPSHVAGRYENDVAGPRVRVIWPAPKTLDEVDETGQYTVTGRVPGTKHTVTARVTVVGSADAESSPGGALAAFPLGQVTLDLDSSGKPTPYARNRDKFIRGLAKTNPDQFLYMFRDAFGQPQPEGAKPLGVWDNQTTRLRGHATGHYLSALTQAYASAAPDSPDRETFLAKMNYTIDTLHDLANRSGVAATPNGEAVADPLRVPSGKDRNGFDSDLREGHVRNDYWNWGRGFISAYPPDQFIMLEQGATYGTNDNQIWAPYYTLHKILAGLLDCYEVGGNEKALTIAKGMGQWCHVRLSALPAQTRIKMWNRYIAGEYGGMNEVMARLARLSGDKQFLETAKLFDNLDFFFGGPDGAAGLSANIDTLRGKHANQHIPQIVGAVETYANTNEPVYLRIAQNFWDITTTSYAYTIGGVAGANEPPNAECFTAEPDSLGEKGFSSVGQNETCATYNMLKLSRGLFMHRPDQAKYMDYYERALINDILASVAEHDAGNTYHISLNPGARKGFGNAAMDGFTCCNGTALESNTKLQDTIYLKSADDSVVYVNLFVPSTLNWVDRKATLRQETRFPYADSTRFTLNGFAGLTLRVRVPGWATRGIEVRVNGQRRAIDAVPGTYLELGKDWKDGDVVELTMPFAFHLDRVMDRPNLASLCYGPVVLAAEEATALKTWRPLTLDMQDLSKSVQGDPGTLRFQVGDLNFKPFFESYGRYSVYFDVTPKR